MILFFQSPTKSVLAVEAAHAFSPEDVQKLVWLFSEATPLKEETLDGWFVGPRREMITPWSTNAVEITQNMGLTGISRIEEYFPVSSPIGLYVINSVFQSYLCGLLSGNVKGKNNILPY